MVGGTELPDRYEDQQQQQETYRGTVFAVLLVLCERERSFAAACELGGSQAWHEQWHGAGVVVEGRAVMGAKFLF